MSGSRRNNQAAIAHEAAASGTTTRRESSTVPMTAEASANSAVAVRAPTVIESSRGRGARVAPAR